MTSSANVSFLTAIKEIELSYTALPKNLRIRIERWVEKLVVSAGSSSNTSWQKHRNDYARLLLNMVLIKRIGEPFLSLPPEGSLPPFPEHLRFALRNSIGSHEGEFWRAIHQRCGDASSNTAAVSFSMQPSSVSSSHNNNTHTQNKKNALPTDVNSLRMLVREQHTRIELLEEQINDERMQHEVDIHRLQYAHEVAMENQRVELMQMYDPPPPPPPPSSPPRTAMMTTMGPSKRSVSPSITSRKITSSSSSSPSPSSFSSTFRQTQQQHQQHYGVLFNEGATTASFAQSRAGAVFDDDFGNNSSHFVAAVSTRHSHSKEDEDAAFLLSLDSFQFELKRLAQKDV